MNRVNPAKGEILRLHAEGRTPIQIAHEVGKTRQCVANVIRRSGMKPNINRLSPGSRPKRPERVRPVGVAKRVKVERGPCDSMVEVERKALVWGMVSRGATVELAAARAGIAVEEAERLAKMCPKNWVRMGRD